MVPQCIEEVVENCTGRGQGAVSCEQEKLYGPHSRSLLELQLRRSQQQNGNAVCVEDKRSPFTIRTYFLMYLSKRELLGIVDQEQIKSYLSLTTLNMPCEETGDWHRPLE